MRHMLRDSQQEIQFGNGIIVYSCEFDSGKRATGSAAWIRLGEDGKIFLFLCHSCMQQLNAEILSPLFIEAIRHDKRISEIVLESIKNKGKD